MGWWSTPPGNAQSTPDGYDETQGKMDDTAWNGIAGSATVVSILKRMAAGGGGSAVTIADGADVAQGTKADVAWVSGDGTVISLLKKIASAGGSAVSIADAANVVEGALADAAIITDTTGTMNGKLRGLVKWAFERMPASLGQKAMAASFPVTIASDQSALTVAAHNVTNAGTFAVQADTELPAAAALADTAGNPTAPAVGAFGMLWNGASWDRVPGSAAAGYKVQSAQLPAALVSGRLSVDASAVAVPITDNAGSLTVDAPVGTPVFVRLSDGAANLIGQKTMANSLPVVIGSDQTAIDHNLTKIAGTAVDVNSGTKSAGSQRIAMVTDQVTLTNLFAQIAASLETNTIYQGTTALTPKFATIVASSSGATQVVALVSSKKIRVLAFGFMCNAAVNVKFQSHVTPTDKTGLFYNAANTGFAGGFCPVGHFETVAGEALDINLSGAVAVGGYLVYVEA